MLAAVYQGPWNVSMLDRPEPTEPRGQQVVVRVRATGICGTDLGIISGAYRASASVILGHESAGEVAAVGEMVRSLQCGDRVAVDPTYYCSVCHRCRTGRSNHCVDKERTETGVSRDGTFASHYMTEERFLYKIDDHVSFAEASLAEPLSCVLTGVKQLRLAPSLRPLVLGAGPIGLLYAATLGLHGLTGGLVETSEHRREMAAAALDNAWWTASSLEQGAQRGSNFDLIVDTTGVLGERAVGLLEPGGQLLLVGLRQSSMTFDPSIVANYSLAILGSIDSLGTFADACALIANGEIPAKRMISQSMPLEELPKALEILGCSLGERSLRHQATALKVIIEP